MTSMKGKICLFYIAHLWILLYFVDNVVGSWCSEDCECKHIENEYGDTEYLCSSPFLRIRIIENNRHFSMICESLNPRGSTNNSNLTELIGSFNLNLGDIETIEIINCSSPRSFSQLFKMLKMTKLEAFTIESDLSNPVSLSSQTLPQSYLLNNLKILILRNSGFIFESPNAFIHLKGLIRLEIYGSHLKPTVPNFTLLKNLNALKLHKVSNLMLQETSFLGLHNLSLLSLTSDNLIHLPKDIFKPLRNLTVCKLSNNLITTIPTDLFYHNLALKEVIWYRDYNADCTNISRDCTREFSENIFGNCLSLSSFYYSSHSRKMKAIFHEGLFSRCKKLKTLHITGAGLTSMNLFDLNLNELISLKRLIIYKNNITHLSKRLLPLSNVAVNLENNPLNCSDCETLSTYLALNSLNQAKCSPEYRFFQNSSNTPREAWTYYNCSSYQSTGAQTIKVPSHLYVLLGVGLILIVILLLVTSLIITSQSIRVRLYNHQFWSLFFENEVDESIKYDAFISYAEEDSDYVHDVILPGLEEGCRHNDQIDLQRRYKCCDHHRDWMVGEEIVKNIIDSVNTSSRTIIILSTHFLSSSWAQMEFDEAYIKRKVILILRGSHTSISDRLKSFPSIQHYVETFTYLQEDDPLFWEKLTYLLPHRKMQKSSILVDTDGRKRSEKVSSHHFPSGQKQLTELKEFAPNLTEEC